MRGDGVRQREAGGVAAEAEMEENRISRTNTTVRLCRHTEKQVTGGHFNFLVFYLFPRAQNGLLV